jgi:hypothetical protein
MDFYSTDLLTDKKTYTQGETVHATLKIYSEGAIHVDHIRAWARYASSPGYLFERTLPLGHFSDGVWFCNFSFDLTEGGKNLEIAAFAINFNGSACSEATKTIFIQEKPLSTVTVTVTDIEGNPIQGAEVLLTEGRITDDNGKVVFSVKDNTYIFEITKDGYVSQWNDHLTINGNTNLNYVLVEKASTTTTTPGFEFEAVLVAVFGMLLLTMARRQLKR